MTANLRKAGSVVHFPQPMSAFFSGTAVHIKQLPLPIPIAILPHIRPRSSRLCIRWLVAASISHAPCPANPPCPLNPTHSRHTPNLTNLRRKSYYCVDSNHTKARTAVSGSGARGAAALTHRKSRQTSTEVCRAEAVQLVQLALEKRAARERGREVNSACSSTTPRSAASLSYI